MQCSYVVYMQRSAKQVFGDAQHDAGVKTISQKRSYLIYRIYIMIYASEATGILLTASKYSAWLVKSFLQKFLFLRHHPDFPRV